jgi:hypothetical protein
MSRAYTQPRQQETRPTLYAAASRPCPQLARCAPPPSAVAAAIWGRPAALAPPTRAARDPLRHRLCIAAFEPIRPEGRELVRGPKILARPLFERLRRHDELKRNVTRGANFSADAPWRTKKPVAPGTATTSSFLLILPDVCVLVLPYKLRRNSIMAALTSGARSCSVQWPQPASTIGGRSSGTNAACLAIAC